MAIVIPADSALGVIADRMLSDPEGGIELARLAIAELVMDDIDRHPHEVSKLFEHLVVDRTEDARRALLKTFISKRASGEDVSEVVGAAMRLALLDSWVTEISKWSEDNPFQESEVRRDAKGRFAKEPKSSQRMMPEEFEQSRLGRNLPPNAGRDPTTGAMFMTIRDEATGKERKADVASNPALQVHLGHYGAVDDARIELQRDFPELNGDTPVKYTIKNKDGSVDQVAGSLGSPPPKFPHTSSVQSVELASAHGLKDENNKLFALGQTKIPIPGKEFLGGGQTGAHAVARQAAFNVVAGATGNKALAYEAGKLTPGTEKFKEGEKLDRAFNAAPGTGRFYDRVGVAGEALTALGLAAPGSGITTLGLVAQTMGAYGSEVENVMGPTVRRTTYRYRGTEKRPTPDLQLEAEKLSATAARPLPAGVKMAQRPAAEVVSHDRQQELLSQAEKEVFDRTGDIDSKMVNARAKQLIEAEAKALVPTHREKLDLEAFQQGKEAALGTKGLKGTTRNRTYSDQIKRRAEQGDTTASFLSYYEGSDKSIPMLRQNVVGDMSAAYLMTKMPNARQVSLALASGQQVPSQGVVIDADGDVVVEAVGYQGDHYLPFNLRNLKHLNGGSYVRTRAQGGPTTEDIYAGLMSNSRQFKTVSGSGVYTVEFSESFRGPYRFNDKAKRMVNDYERILDRLKNEGQFIQEGLSGGEIKDIKQQAWDLSGGDAESYRSHYTALKDKVIRRKEASQLSPEEARDVAVQEMKADPQYRQLSPQALARAADVRAKQIYEDARQGGPQRLVLNGEGYKAALDTLKAQHPYYIKDVRWEPLPEFVEDRGLGSERKPTALAAVAASRGKPERADTGYVLPGNVRPAAETAGYYESGYRNAPKPAQSDKYRREALKNRGTDTGTAITEARLPQGGTESSSVAGVAPTTGAVATSMIGSTGRQLGSLLGQVHRGAEGNLPGWGTGATTADVDMNDPSARARIFGDQHYAVRAMESMGAFNDYPGFLQTISTSGTEVDRKQAVSGVSRTFRKAAREVNARLDPEWDTSIQRASGFSGPVGDGLLQAANAADQKYLADRKTAPVGDLKLLTTLQPEAPLAVDGVSNVTDRQQLQALLTPGSNRPLNKLPSGFTRQETGKASQQAAMWAREIEGGGDSAIDKYSAFTNGVNSKVDAARGVIAWAQNPTAPMDSITYNKAVQEGFIPGGLGEEEFKPGGRGIAHARGLANQLRGGENRTSSVNEGVEDLAVSQLAFSMLQQRIHLAAQSGRIGWNPASSPRASGGGGGQGLGYTSTTPTTSPTTAAPPGRRLNPSARYVNEQFSSMTQSL